MTPKERVMARFEGHKTDRLPNYCIVMAFAAKMIGVPYSQYVTDYKTLVRGAMHCCEEYGIDVLSVISDPVREAAGFGAVVNIPEDGVPHCPEPLIKSLSDLSKLKTYDPASKERTNDRLEAVGLFKEQAGNHYPILGWVEGPIASSCCLRGLTNIMTDMLDEPSAVEELMDICNQQAILFAQAQIALGADIIGVGDAAASLIGASLYEEFVLPRQKKLFEAIHAAGAKVKLHICGNINPLLDLIADSGADMVDCDWMVDFDKAVRVLGKASACGNFDPVDVLLNGSLEEVRAAVLNCVEVASPTTAIAAGCEVPRDTPVGNLLGVFEVLCGV